MACKILGTFHSPNCTLFNNEISTELKNIFVVMSLKFISILTMEWHGTFGFLTKMGQKTRLLLTLKKFCGRTLALNDKNNKAVSRTTFDIFANAMALAVLKS